MQNAPRIIQTWLRQGLHAQTRSIRGRLMLILAALAAVLLTLELVQHTIRLDQRRELVQKYHKLAAEEGANSVQSQLDQLFRDQQLIVYSLGRTTDRQALLEDILKRYRGLQWIGVVWPGQPPLESRVGTYPAVNHTGLREAVRGANTRYVSDVVAAEGTNPPVPVIRVISRIPEAVESADREDERGVVVAMEFDPKIFPSYFQVPKKDGGELLLDSHGYPIFTTGEAPPVELARSAPGVKRAVEGRSSFPVDFVLGKDRELHGFAVPVLGTNWTLIYAEGEDTVLAGVDRDIWRLILLPLSIVAILGVALQLILQISVRPVHRFAAATRTLGTGDLGVRLDRPEVDEFEPLMAAFNSMAERLELIQLALIEANERLEEDKHQLDLRVKEATRELQQEHERLLRSERLSTLGLFSSAIAHDLRNPLNTVSLTVEWLRTRLAETEDERLRSRLETMRRELRRADQIIRTLLGFARTGEPDLAPTDLNELLREIADVVDPPENVTLRLDLDEHLPAIPADRAQLFQVFENLVRNAIQAMPEGGEVRLGSRSNCEYCHFTVADTGPGVPEEAKDRIFEPLVSGKATGTGIGLALARRIVEAHHGHIHLESAPGEGAVFEIELPATPHLAEPDGAAGEPGK